MPDRTGHALSFGQAAEAYDRHRPGYPPAAVQWALGEPATDPHREPPGADPPLPPRTASLASPPADASVEPGAASAAAPGAAGPREPSAPREQGATLRVVDLGAGTGILTRVLLALGHDAVPVEPDAQMRARLVATTPAAVVAGSAEHIPLPDSSVDAVVAGQAYHWFDPARAHTEIARVLRPGGCFAALWNVRDESSPWLARLSEIAHLEDGSGREEHGLHDDWLLAAGFGPVSQAVFSHATSHTPDSLIELIKTRSYYLTSPPDRQAAIVAGIRELATRHPDLAGRSVFELPYRTIVYRTVRH